MSKVSFFLEKQNILLNFVDFFKINYYTLCMGCSECKKNKTIKEEVLKSTEFIQKGIVWFVLIWSVFAIYGIYTFINKFL